MNQMASSLEYQLASAYKARQARYAARAVPQTKEEIARTQAASMTRQMADFKEKWEAEQERLKQEAMRTMEGPLLLAKRAAEDARQDELRRLQYPSVRKIVAAVSDAFSVSATDILSPSRTRGSVDGETIDVITPRQVAMYLARKVTLLSLTTIGKSLNRDHTTVHSGGLKVEQMMASDPVFRAKVEALREEIAPTQGSVP